MRVRKRYSPCSDQRRQAIRQLPNRTRHLCRQALMTSATTASSPGRIQVRRALRADGQDAEQIGLRVCDGVRRRQDPAHDEDLAGHVGAAAAGLGVALETRHAGASVTLALHPTRRPKSLPSLPSHPWWRRQASAACARGRSMYCRPYRDTSPRRCLSLCDQHGHRRVRAARTLRLSRSFPASA